MCHFFVVNLGLCLGPAERVDEWQGTKVASGMLYCWKSDISINYLDVKPAWSFAVWGWNMIAVDEGLLGFSENSRLAGRCDCWLVGFILDHRNRVIETAIIMCLKKHL